MKIHHVDPDVQKIWKIFPLRISGESICRDCNEETVLVQSQGGGFVTRNCPRCNKFHTLTEHDFRKLNLWVACPKCKKRMTPEILYDKNYGYVCKNCDIGIPLYMLLPRYTDL